MPLVQVTQQVHVSVDEAKFTPEFMADFRDVFYPFQTVEDHVRHLGQLFARGIVYNGAFIEGYGKTEEMGIRFEEEDVLETEIVA
jgi:hypothetical protein